MMKKFKKRYIINGRYLFIITSILFGLCYLFEVPHGDDVNFYYVESGKLIDCFNKSLLLTKGSFYSLFTNTYIMYINNKPLFVFILVMMATMFIMQEAMRELFSKNRNNEKIINCFIACAVCSYSFVDMASAGWVDTSMSYFLPVTTTFVSLIPLKKIYKNEKINNLEYFIYIIALFIAIDNTQAMAMLLVCYGSFVIYLLINRKKQLYIFFMFVVIILFAFMALTSPRFSGRVIGETIKRLPTIGKLNFLSKVDLAVFPTIRWIFYGDNFFTILVLIIFIMFIFKKYKTPVYRIISILPLIIILFTRPYINGNLSINAYDLGPIEFGTSNYGLFNVYSVYTIDLSIQYIILCSLIIIVVIEMILLLDNIYDLLITFIILGAGFGTRAAMAFTPTVFASHLRTYIYLGFSIIAATIFIFSKNIVLIDANQKKKLGIVLVIACILMLGYFFVYVYNYMGSSLLDLFIN